MWFALVEFNFSVKVEQFNQAISLDDQVNRVVIPENECESSLITLSRIGMVISMPIRLTHC